MIHVPLMGYVGLLVAGLAGFAVWPNLRRSLARGEATRIHGVPCTTTQQRQSRSQNVAVTVSIPCDERFEFELRREGMFDRAAKAVRLVREFQTNDERFDEAIYIGSDERGIDAWLARDAEARSTFLDLLASRPEENTRITAIRADRGSLKLSALTKPPLLSSAPDDIALTVANACVPRLKTCVDRLQAFAATDPDPSEFHDPYGVTVRTLTSMALGLIFVPCAVILVAQLQAPRVELMTGILPDRFNLMAIAGVLGVLTVTSVPLLWGSARIHTVMALLLMCGGFGAAFASPTLLRVINSQWDKSTPQRHSAKVIGHTVTRGRRSTTYHVWLSDEQAGQSQEDFRVDQALYERLMDGDIVTFWEREGYLGRPWVSDLRTGSPADFTDQ